MKSENMLSRFVIGALLGTTLMACNNGSIQTNDVDRCTKVYILVDDAMKREYQRFVPAAQDWAYLVTEYGFKDGSAEHVYRYDHNIFLNRKKKDVEHKIVTQTAYLESCGDDRSRNDTIYLMVDNGEKYSEFLVKERFDLETKDESVIIHNIYGDSELLVDFSMKQDQSTPLDSVMHRIAVRKVSEFDCHLIHQVTRFNGLDSINESFVRGVGSMHRRTPQYDIRLNLINDLTIPAYLDEACK